MPKAYDVRHNYYQDLELPTTATLEDVKKSYRKLALLYHPDRNAGKEEEYIPKFQAIQAAHEILGDALQKSKYDADRRKAGLYPNLNPNVTSTSMGGRSNPVGNPYQATSAYPPPPRRTAPGTWQRPTAGPQPAGASTYSQTGADRFANFARAGAAPTAKKSDAAQDRTNMFEAWQNMNNAQQRQQQQQRHQQYAPGQRPVPQPSPQPSPQPQATPRRPAAPPRQDTEFPTEEKIRAGMNHHRGPPPTAFNKPATDRAEERQSAWQAFQQAAANQGKAGIGRSNTHRTPRKPSGFDPNAPGSDERPAPNSYHNMHRHRSEDFGRAKQAGGPMPPPPPGPPPASQPTSPQSPRMPRPMADPLRPFRSRTTDEEVPYAEGSRQRTPYASFIGEKYESADAGLRRTNSSRDTTKLHTEANTARPRSTSPLGRQRPPPDHQSRVDPDHLSPNQNRPSFTMYSSSEGESDPDITNTPDEYSPTSVSHGFAPKDRPKKVPSPPSKKMSGAKNPFAPPSAGSNIVNDGEYVGGDGAQSDGEAQGIRQKAQSNMYAHPPFTDHEVLQHVSSGQSPFNSSTWAQRMFGSYSTAGASRVPPWAMPASVSPKQRRQDKRDTGYVEPFLAHEPGVVDVGQVDEVFARSTEDEQRAFMSLRYSLGSSYGDVPPNLDMEVFLKLASTARSGRSTTHSLLDGLLSRTLHLYPSVGYRQFDPHADGKNNSFTFPVNDDLFAHTNGKARSEENINTKFSTNEWQGSFSGSPDYFAPPTGAGGRKTSGSPTRRTNGQRSSMRSATSHIPPITTTTPNGDTPAPMPPPPRPATGDGMPMSPTSNPTGVKFSKEQWESTFKDASWTWPPPPPQPDTPARPASKSRKSSSKPSARATSAMSDQGTATNPHVVEDSGTSRNPHVVPEVEEDVPLKKSTSAPATAVPVDDADAMDIDSTPPVHQNGATSTQAANTKEPRMVSVPPSPWRQQQANGHRKASSTSSRSQRDSTGAKIRTNLDDLANVAPFVQSANGIQNLADLGQTLPFPSQPSATLPMHPSRPQTLQTPKVPKVPEPPQKLSKDSWHAYCGAFATYLHAFQNWNGIMLNHFNARQLNAQSRMQQGMGWLEATGDTSGMLTGPSGYGSYLQGVKEDQRVREIWNTGCERHAEAARKFEDIRVRVRMLAAGGTLVDR